MAIQHFKDLKVWQQGHELVLLIYQATESFPQKEMFRLSDQLRRAAVSVTSNIAEGFGRKSPKEKLYFYSISHGSLLEIENQTLIAKDLNYIEIKEYNTIQEKISELSRMLTVFKKNIPQS